jgi:hypothetical protein
VTLVGRLACLGCELKLRYGAPSDCGTTGHIFGFRAEDGNLFTLLDTDRSRPMIRGEKHANELMQVKALRYPRSMILEVQEVGPAPAGATKSAGGKTYYCKICAITAYAPGACVCCGEPVEEANP